MKDIGPAPKILDSLNRALKIPHAEHERIIGLYNSGVCITDIRKEYGVSFCCIRRIVDPEFKKDMSRRVKEWNKFKCLTDPEFYEKQKKAGAASTRRKRQLMPEANEWRRKQYHATKPSAV